MADDYDTLGRRLRTVRLGLGLDQQVVSKALGIAPTVISKHEHDRRNVSEEAALRYAKYYGIPVEHLLDAPREKRPPIDVDVIPRFQGEPKSRGERLERLRQSRGFMKLAPTARMIGINPTTMTHHEKGLREITRQAAELYARFFHIPAGFILFGDDCPTENYADIVGQIRARGRVVMTQDGSDEHGGVRRVPTPSGLVSGTTASGEQPKLVAFVVIGDDLYPAYFHGDVVVVAKEHGPIVPIDVNGHECIVTTASGENLLGIIKSEGGEYYSIIGPHAPPQFHIRLLSAEPVLQIFRGLLRTLSRGGNGEG